MAEIQSYLNIIKNAQSGESVRDAIVQCMNAINSDTELKIEPKVIRSNGTHHAGNGKAWRTVTVDVEGGGDQSEISFAAFNVTDFTENGTYTPQTEGYDENTYFNEVNVEITPQLGLDGVADEVIVDQVATDDKGQYYDMSWVGGGIWAAKRVYFSNEYMLPEVPDPYDPSPGKQYTVTFCNDDGTQIKAGTVPKGGNAYDYITIDETAITPKLSTHAGWEFNGWDENIYNIQKSIKTKAVFTKPGGLPAGEISDDWATIVANRGMPYSLGDYKYLQIASTVQLRDSLIQIKHNDKTTSSVQLRSNPLETLNLKMMKVYGGNGEEGSSSTWLAVNPLIIGSYNWETDGIKVESGLNPPSYGGRFTAKTEYEGCDYYYNVLWKFLSEYLITAFPDPLKDGGGIKSVKKKAFGRYNDNPCRDSVAVASDPKSRVREFAAQRIWLPSIKEISHLLPKDASGNVAPDHYGGINEDPTMCEFENSMAVYSVWQPDIVEFPSAIDENHNIKIPTRSYAVCQKPLYPGEKQYKCREMYCPGEYDEQTQQYTYDYTNSIVNPRVVGDLVVGNSVESYLYIGFCL